MMKLFNNNQFRILEAFLRNLGKQLFMREIGRLSGLDIKIISRELKLLLENNILDYEQRGKIKLYHVKNTIESETMIVATEAYKTREFLDMYDELKLPLIGLNKKTDFIIFGSYAKGSENKNSDVDIVIFSSKSSILEALLEKFQKKLHKQYIKFEEFSLLYEKNSVLTREILRSHVLFGKHKEIAQMVLRWKELPGA